MLFIKNYLHVNSIEAIIDGENFGNLNSLKKDFSNQQKERVSVQCKPGNAVSLSPPVILNPSLGFYCFTFHDDVTQVTNNIKVL